MAAIFELPHTSACPSGVRVPPPSSGGGRPPTAVRPGATAVLAVALLVVVLATAAGHLRGPSAGGAGRPGAVAVPSGEAVVVGPGDTLWSIAEEHYPPSLHSRAVAALAELNGPSGSLEVGDVVSLAALG